MSLRRRLLSYRGGSVLSPLVDAHLRGGTPQFAPEIWDEVLRLALKEPRDRRRSFSASGLDRCMREQMMRLLGYPHEEVPDQRLANIFLDGNWRHLRWQALFLEMGIVPRGFWTEENGITISAGGDYLLEVGVYAGSVRGTIDAIVEIGGERWIVDIKGANPRAFSDVKGGGQPYAAYRLQLHAYMRAARVPQAILWYEDKGSQEYLEVPLRRDDEETEARYAARVGALELYYERQELPPPLHNATSNPACRGCGYQLDCLRAEWTEAHLRDDEEDVPL